MSEVLVAKFHTRGHLIDSGLLSDAMEAVHAAGATYDVVRLDIGKRRSDDSELELGHNGALNGAAGWMGHRPGRGGTLVILGNSWPRSGGSYDYQYPLMLSWDIWDIVEAADP